MTELTTMREKTPEYYKPGAGPRRDYTRIPTPDEVTRDLNKAHDNIKKLVSEKDQLRHRLNWCRIWTKVLTAAVAAQWAVILTLLKLLIFHK